jgi:hypothetical protein
MRALILGVFLISGCAATGAISSPVERSPSSSVSYRDASRPPIRASNQASTARVGHASGGGRMATLRSGH